MNRRQVPRAGLLSLVLLLTTLALSSVGCASQPQEKAPYKIGAILSTSGELGSLGTPQKNSALMAVDQINAQGGIDGHKVVLAIVDDESDDTKAVNAMIKLATQEKVSAVFGPTAAGTYAVMDNAKQYSIPLVVPQPEEEITQKGNSWVFRAMITDPLYAARVVEYVKGKGWSRMAILHDSTDYGTSAAEVFRKETAKAGVTLTAVEKYEPKDSDMTTVLTKIKATNPQVIVVWGTVPGPAIIAKNAKTLGISVPFIGGTGINNPKFIELAADAANGWVYPGAPFSIADQIKDKDYQERALAFNKSYSDKYGSPPGSFGALGWDGVNLLMSVMRKAGDDPKKIREALDTFEFKGVFGTYKYTPTNHNGLGTEGLYIIRIDNGQRFLVE